MPNINIKYACNLIGIANHMLATEGATFYFKKVNISEAAHDDEVPHNDYVVGDTVDITNYNTKTNALEVLVGHVIEINCKDENGWFNRVDCDGRKFRIPIISNTQRLGTLARRRV
ncbi:MAG: hypothetical protein HUJ56_03690 [Erysipelotrichaceae bacterium]|nr:hypothetical protein [Erysipelotrichaceae bacterium]